jgi:uncharacterized protein YndB with AHSA1/START domain
MNAKNPDLAAGEEMVLTRVLAAPRTLVFKAWTDPEQLAEWWGPHGFTAPRCEVDARPGGALRIDMRGPDGVTFPMVATFTELVEPERLSFTATVPDEDGVSQIETRTIVTFEEQGGKTTLTVRSRVVKATKAGETYVEGMQVGWSQTIERLAELVAKA